MTSTLRAKHPVKGLLRFGVRLPLWLYRAHVGWLLGERFLRLTHIGRKSGQPRQTVLEVIEHDRATDAYIIAAGWGEKSDWFQNVLKTPHVVIDVGRRHLNVTAEHLSLEAAEQWLFNYAQAHPRIFQRLAKFMTGESLGVTRAECRRVAEADRANVSRIYANMGKAIAAYERKIMPGPAKFDRYVEAILRDDLATARSIYAPEEAAGLRLFISKGNCTDCHNGPLFTNNDFHNTGVPAVASLPEDTGRAKGIQQVVADEFNCSSQYSDAGKTDCGELRFIKTDDDHDLMRQFKPPSLRNVAERAPYMNAGQFKTLDEVVNHYSRAPETPAGHSELKPLNLSDTEKTQLITFLKTLSGPLATAPAWLNAPGN